MSIKRIKKSITEQEYRKLIDYTLRDDKIKDFSQKRFQMIFCLLYYSGVRVNELSQLTYLHLKEIINYKETIITTHKTKSERILYFSSESIIEIKKYFNLNKANNEYVITSWNSVHNQLNNIALINLVNKYMKSVLGKGFSSHSFRQGIISEMGSKSINPRIIQSFIGHSDIKTTMRYMRPTANDVKRSLIR